MPDATSLVEALTRRLGPCPPWLERAPLVLALAGPNSIFRLTASILETLPGRPAVVTEFGVEDVRAALEVRCGDMRLTSPHAHQ
jgi:hypothetical protein